MGLGPLSLPPSAVLLSEHLKEQGFRTGSFIANGYVSDRFGFNQGWDHYTNYIRENKDTEAANVFAEDCVVDLRRCGGQLYHGRKDFAAYASALALQGIKAERLPATECTLAGLALLSPQTLAAQ